MKDGVEITEKELRGLRGEFGEANWPWKNIKASVGEMVKGGGGCKKWAEKIRSALGGDIIKIAPNPKKALPGARLGPVRTPKGELISQDFVEHYAVRIGDWVYDRITGPQGMHIEEYQKLLSIQPDSVASNPGCSTRKNARSGFITS